MNNNHFIKLLIFLFVMFFSTSALAAEKLSVYVVNYPLKYFTERIGGEHVEVSFPAPAGVDPAFWVPSAENFVAYQQADIIFLNGADYARWVKRTSLPMLKTYDTSRYYKEKYIHKADAMVHSHGSEAEHSHGETAFTTWLDFDLAAMQAKAIADILGQKRPDLVQTYQLNFEALKKDLKMLDQEMKKIVGENVTQTLVASHPVYQYLARRYQISIKSVHWEPELVPNLAQWGNLKSIVDTDHPKWMIWEGSPNQVTLRRLRSQGINSAVFKPCANRPDQGDWLDVMRQNLDNLRMVHQ